MAADGIEGLQKAKELKPKLILCDVMMPKMNGLEVLEKLKADPELKDIPVIMLTNLSGTHDAETAMKRGAFAYMVKSEYKPREIAMKVKETISGTNQAEPSQPQPSSAQTPAETTPPQPTTADSQPTTQPDEVEKTQE
jgi:CheY-like chemotaxis protein